MPDVPELHEAGHESVDPFWAVFPSYCETGPRLADGGVPRSTPFCGSALH